MKHTLYHFFIKKKIILDYPKSAAVIFFPADSRTSSNQPLKFYCISSIDLQVRYISADWLKSMTKLCLVKLTLTLKIDVNDASYFIFNFENTISRTKSPLSYDADSYR